MSALAGRKRTNKEQLAYWMLERENIRQKKEASLPKPWTEDWVFQTTYFCNVRREDDKVTRWIRQNWNPAVFGWDDYEYAIVIARMLNWPDTLEDLLGLGWIGNIKEIQWKLESLASMGEHVWGSAYVVTTHGLRMPKAQYLCENVLPAAYKALGAGRWRKAYASGPVYLAQRYEELMQLEGIASFMSAQIIADLKNTPGHPLVDAEDWAAWSAHGPGSLRGLQWFYGKDGHMQKEKIRPMDYELGILGVKEWLLSNHPAALWPLFHNKNINMQDLQNCMCEYDKYMRVLHGTGRSKRHYDGG